MSEQRPERGGAWDFAGRIRPDYSPRRDGDPDPGEVVWVWVPYEEDPSQGKDRPVAVIGYAEDDPALLVGLMLSSRAHDGEASWHAIGSGGWDGEHRPSWARIDRPLAMTAASVRREGSALGQATFLALVEHAAGRPAPRPRHGAGQARGGRVTRLVGVYRANGGLLGEAAYVLGKLVRVRHCSLCDVTHSPIRRKAVWDDMVDSLGVPFDLVHLNERTPEVAAVVGSKHEAPAVLAEAGGRWQVVLTPQELEPLGGSVVAFERALKAALARRSLHLG